MKKRKSLMLFTILLLALALASTFLVNEAGATSNLENFTRYIEVDPNGHISVASETHVDFAAYRNETAYLYSDKGANQFSGDFIHKVDRWSGNTMGQRGAFWALTNDLGDQKTLADVSKNFLCTEHYYSEETVNHKILIHEYYGGSSYSDSCTISATTWYYLTIERSGSSFSCGIYSSAALRDVGDVPDVGILSLTLHSVVAYQYVFGAMSYNDGNNVFNGDMDVENLDVEAPYDYTFNGLYDEPTGDFLTTGVNVTAYFVEGTTPTTFEVNGTYHLPLFNRPVYFVFDLTNPRQYWVSNDEDSATIYIFDATTTVYTITFIDLTNVLEDYSYVMAKRQVNGTLYTVEKRRVNKDDTVVMSLETYALYTISIREGTSYDYGEIVLTSDTTVQLTLTGLEFPTTVVEGYKYVRVWCYRNYSTGTTIKVNYQDLQSQTSNVSITIRTLDDATAYSTWSVSQSFIVTWANANNVTDYYVLVNIERTSGAMKYRQYLPRRYAETSWSLDFLWNSAPFNTNIMIPSFIILCVAGVFSALNARVGAFAFVISAIILTWIWGLPIPQEALLLALVLTIIVGMVYGKSRVIVE